jgi:hypothetical protein
VTEGVQVLLQVFGAEEWAMYAIVQVRVTCSA